MEKREGKCAKNVIDSVFSELVGAERMLLKENEYEKLAFFSGIWRKNIG